MSDLVGGKYPQLAPLSAFTGGLSNVAQSNIPARSNAEWYGLSGLSDGALAGSGIGCVVPVPVDPFMTISAVNIIIGGTAASTPTHQFAAIYAGTGSAPALLGQSTDTTTAAIAASLPYHWTLATPLLITPTQAPNGFVYVVISITASTVPTAASVATVSGVNNGSAQWGANAPLFLSSTAGSALAGTAAATIASPSTKAVAPIVFLT